MKNAKIIKNIYVVFICLAAVALICLNIYQRHKIIMLSQSINQQAPVNPISSSDQTSEGKDASRSIPGKGIIQDNPDGLSYQLDAAKEELDMVNRELSDEAAKKAELKEKELESFKDTIKDPNYKNRLMQSLESHYSLLFKKLNLPEDKLERFKELINNYGMASTNFFVEIQAVSTSEAEEKRAEFKDRSAKLKEAHEMEVVELIGRDNFEKYETYNETAGERSTLELFLMSYGSESNLTDGQMEQLISAMYEARKNVIYEDIDDNFRFPSEMYDEGYIARSLDHETQKYEAYLTAAENIMSPSQTEQFKAYLERQREQYESYMKVQALKYGTSAETN